MNIYKDIYYTKIPHEEKKLDLYIPDSEEFDIFIGFHGGGLENGSKDNYLHTSVEYLLKRNIAFATVEYRMYPEAHYPDYICDAAAAIAWIKNNISNYGKCRKIFVGGSSAGGYLSMMLCFDKRYLAPYKIHPTEIAGYIHDAGQPTTHFNILRERGLDPWRAIIDEAAPIYHIGTEQTYANMLFVVADNDMASRYEQTMLALSTMKHFGHEDKCTLKYMQGYTHCGYNNALDENGEPVFGKTICDYIKSLD